MTRNSSQLLQRVIAVLKIWPNTSLAVFWLINLQYYREDISLMRGISIFQKPSYREIRPMRGRLMRGLPVPVLSFLSISTYCFIRFPRFWDFLFFSCDFCLISTKSNKEARQLSISPNSFLNRTDLKKNFFSCNIEVT